MVLPTALELPGANGELAIDHKGVVSEGLCERLAVSAQRLGSCHHSCSSGPKATDSAGNAWSLKRP